MEKNVMYALRETIDEIIKIVDVIRKESYNDGIRAAASFVGEFDKQIEYPFHMEDVVLCKFNLTKKKPRKKRKK